MKLAARRSKVDNLAGILEVRVVPDFVWALVQPLRWALGWFRGGAFSCREERLSRGCSSGWGDKSFSFQSYIFNRDLQDLSLISCVPSPTKLLQVQVFYPIFVSRVMFQGANDDTKKEGFEAGLVEQDWGEIFHFLRKADRCVGWEQWNVSDCLRGAGRGWRWKFVKAKAELLKEIWKLQRGMKYGWNDIVTL